MSRFGDAGNVPLAVLGTGTARQKDQRSDGTRQERDGAQEHRTRRIGAETAGIESPNGDRACDDNLPARDRTTDSSTHHIEIEKHLIRNNA